MSVIMDRLRQDQMRRQRLWSAPALASAVNDLALEVRLRDAKEAIAPHKQEVKMGTNTGAKGFAAILKARAAQMREEFSRLADEVNGEFNAMETHLANGKAAVSEMKKDNAELREALGFANDPDPAGKP